MENKGQFLSQPHVTYKKSELKSASGLNLRSSDWMVLTQVNGNQTVEEIANKAAMQLAEVTTILENLFNLGLIELFSAEKKEENVLGQKFFENMENMLIKIIGPVAPFVIDDVLQETGLNKSKFPSEKVAEFVELISDEIQDEQKKIQFQSEMLNIIKKELI
jgi:DNA-binding Lrp family transcriptional regulator